MLKIFHVPGARSVRPIWLCYELDLPVQVEQLDFSNGYRDSEQWRSISPAGKIPALVDADLTMFESGAMVEYILERYGNGRLQPSPGTKESALFHQWCWFAEATLIRPLGLYRILRVADSDTIDLAVEAKRKFYEALNVLEAALVDRKYLLGEEFSAADIMMGYSVAMVERLLSEDHLHILGYLENLKSRSALQRVMALNED